MRNHLLCSDSLQEHLNATRGSFPTHDSTSEVPKNDVEYVLKDMTPQHPFFKLFLVYIFNMHFFFYHYFMIYFLFRSVGCILRLNSSSLYTLMTHGKHRLCQLIVWLLSWRVRVILSSGLSCVCAWFSFNLFVYLFIYLFIYLFVNLFVSKRWMFCFEWYVIFLFLFVCITLYMSVFVQY
jgi:hypothetical protein